MAKKTPPSQSGSASLASPYDLPPDFDPKIPARETILELLRTHQYTLSLEELAELTNLSLPLSIGAERRLQAMQRDGQLHIDEAGRIHMDTETHFIEGVVQGHRDGFGFLIRDDRGPDLFLSPREMLRVLHGDRVRVREDGEYRGRAEAVIVEVLERRNEQLVGRLVHEHGHYSVIPEDQRIKHDIRIAPSDTNGAKAGQVVVIAITRQPARHTQPMGKVIEVLGEVDDPGMEIEIAVRKFDVPFEFSKGAQQQAKAIPDHVQAPEYKGRVDLRDLPFITIDGEDARDFDDAVYCERVDIGRGKRERHAWRLLVAIADVSHYVKPDSPIDQNAIERGTSVYFPRRVIPMLPEALSNGICSLNPDVDRLVLVCDMIIPLDGKTAGTVTAYQFYEAVIHSYARTTYTQVWEALQQSTGPAAQSVAEVLPTIQQAYELYRQLAKARKERGAIDFETVETKIVCNPLGRIERIEPMIRNDAHKLIEEFMLAANTCAADFMQRHRRQGLYRVHEGPTPEKLQRLRDFLRTLGLHLEGGDEPTTEDYARLIQEARSRSDFEIIQTMCLRSMQQAVYSPDNMGHFGLAYKLYTHFTSPIRRYPDLLTHRVIKGILHNRRYVPELEAEPGDDLLSASKREQAQWERLGVMLSARERRADEASYDVQAWLKCYFVKEHIGEIFSGKVTGVANFGLFVTLDKLYVEGLVHISELGADYFVFNEATHDLVGERTGIRYKLTDTVQVQVVRVDLEARRIDFRLVPGTGYQALLTPRSNEARGRPKKKAASAKPKALRGTTASERRALAKKQSRQAAKKTKLTKAKRSRR